MDDSMKIAFSEISTPSKGVIAVGVTEDRTLGATGRALDEQSGGVLGRALAAGRFTGKRGTSTTIVAPHGLVVDAVILVGLGQPGKIDGRQLRALGGAVVGKMNAAGAKTGAIAVDAVDGAAMTPPAMAAEIALGARLGSYSFDKYHTKKKEEGKKSLGQLTVMLDEPAAAEGAFAPNDSLATGVFVTRDLVSEPSNIKYPKTIAKDIEALVEDGIEVELFDRERMASLGMGSLLGVAQGSEHEPYLAIMRWNGAPEGADAQPVAFVGKGVTFDTGGISIKQSQGMEEMKYDMAGAATVIGLMKCLAGRTARVNVIGVVGLVENMPDGKAQRPGRRRHFHVRSDHRGHQHRCRGAPRARRCALVHPGDLQAEVHCRSRDVDRRRHHQPRHLSGGPLQQQRRAVGAADLRRVRRAARRSGACRSASATTRTSIRPLRT